MSRQSPSMYGVVKLLPRILSSPDFHVILMLWIIWNRAEPHTTNMNNPKSTGPTAYFSSFGLSDLDTFPL